jgi:C-terminal processing protease CtpA/Prc
MQLSKNLDVKQIDKHLNPSIKLNLTMKKLLFAFAFLCIQNLLAQPNLPNKISVADKIYGLSKFWQEVNYNFIYLNKVDKKMWDSSYRAYIVKVQESKNDYEYYKELQKFCALLKDGHTDVYLPSYVQEFELNTMFGDYRLFLKNIENKVIIERVNLSKKNEIPIGSEIIEVNGLKTKEYAEKYVKPYLTSSTDYVMDDRAAYNLLRGLEGASYDVKIRTPQNEEKILKLTHTRSTETELFPPFQQDSLLDLKWVNDKVLYMALNSFGNDKINSDFEKNLAEIYKAKGLIIDLRKNGGGNTNVGTGILQYLTNDAVLHGARYSTREHLASYKAWGAFTSPKDTIGNEWQTKSYLYANDAKYHFFDYEPDTIKITAKRLVVPTVVLFGHDTGSAAEDFLIAADNQKHFIKMGQRSFGSTGQPLSFGLPGGGSARICTKRDTYADGREFVGVGIIPEIEIIPTLNDFINKYDRTLDEAIKVVSKQIK